MLEAAHIRPLKEEQRHDVRNGLLLRFDVHRFDAGYMTVTAGYRFEVGDRRQMDVDDGEDYYGLGGRSISRDGSIWCGMVRSGFGGKVGVPTRFS